MVLRRERTTLLRNPCIVSYSQNFAPSATMLNCKPLLITFSKRQKKSLDPLHGDQASQCLCDGFRVTSTSLQIAMLQILSHLAPADLDSSAEPLPSHAGPRSKRAGSCLPVFAQRAYVAVTLSHAVPRAHEPVFSGDCRRVHPSQGMIFRTVDCTLPIRSLLSVIRQANKVIAEL